MPSKMAYFSKVTVNPFDYYFNFIISHQ